MKIFSQFFSWFLLKLGRLFLLRIKMLLHLFIFTEKRHFAVPLEENKTFFCEKNREFVDSEFVKMGYKLAKRINFNPMWWIPHTSRACAAFWFFRDFCLVTFWERIPNQLELAKNRYILVSKVCRASEFLNRNSGVESSISNWMTL